MLLNANLYISVTSDF